MNIEKTLRILFTTFIGIAGLSLILFVGILAFSKVDFSKLELFDYTYITLMSSLLLAGFVLLVKGIMYLIESIND